MKPISNALTKVNQFADAARQKSITEAAEAEARRNAEREEQLAREAAMHDAALALRFPKAHEGNYFLPNSLVRGGLFGAIKDAPRRELKGHEVSSLSNYRITYTGEQLSQSDLDTLMALICERLDLPFGDTIQFTAYAILTRMGWNTSSTGYERLRQSIDRLQRAQVKIEYERGAIGKRPVRYTGSFVSNFLEADNRSLSGDDNDTRRTFWSLTLDPNLAALFANEDVTLGLWFLRRKVDGRMPLAQFLLNFYLTHRAPLPLSVGKLVQLGASGEKNESNAIYRLERALRKLVDIGFLESFEIEGGPNVKSTSRLVKVVRVPPAVIARRAREEINSRRIRSHRRPVDRSQLELPC